MDLDLLVILPGAVKKERSFFVSSDLSVDQALESLFKQHGSHMQLDETEFKSEWGLFIIASGQWLSLGKKMSDYDLSNQTKLELKLRKSPLQIWLADDSSVILPAADMSQPVASVMSAIASKLRFQEFAGTYGFKKAYLSSTNSDTKKQKHRMDDEAEDPAPFATKAEWLKMDETLSAQGIRDGDSIVLLKKFVHRSPSPQECVSAADEHMSFSLARSQILSGFYDDVLFMELSVELAAILLLHTAGKYSPELSANYVHDNKSSILSPKWRKKLKADIAAHIITTHMAISNLPWAFDPRGVKQQFLFSMFKVSTYGIEEFKVESVRQGLHVVDDAIISVSSSRILAKKNKSSSDSSIQVPMQSIERVFVTKRSVRFVFRKDASAASPQDFTITSPKEGHLIVEAINGYKAAWDAAQLPASQTRLSRTDSRVSITSVLGRGIQPSASSPSISSTRKRSAESIESDEFLAEECAKLEIAAGSLQPLLTGSKRSHRSRHQSLNVSLSSSSSEAPTTMFTQAATHLSSVSRGLASMAIKLRAGPFFEGSEWRKSEAIISQWCTAVCSIASCVAAAGSLLGPGIQSIAFTARMLMEQSKHFVSFIGSTRAKGDNKRSSVRTELPTIEKAVLATCAALDLALQDKMCDESSACNMFMCCGDINSTAHRLLSQAEMVTKLLGDQPNAAVVDSERRKATIVFSWYQRLFCACAPVAVADSEALCQSLKGGLDSFSSSANALLAAILDSFDKLTTGEDSPKGGNQDTITPAAVKSAWGSLNLSLRCFSTISRSAAQPLEQVDPILPPVLYNLTLEVQQSLLSLLSPAPPPLSRVVAHLATQATGLVRTLAVLASLEPSPTIILQSAMIESALEKLKNNLKQAETPQQFSRLLTVQQALSILDAGLVTVSDTRAPAKSKADGLITGLRLLMLSFLQLRSTLRLASSLPVSTRMVDVAFVGRYLERLDPIVDEALPLLTSASSMKPDGSFAVTYDQMAPAIDFWTRELKALSSKAESERSSLGVFAEILSSQRKRLNKRIESVQSMMTLLQSQQQSTSTGAVDGRALAKGMKRLSSVRQILMRPSATSFSLMRISEGSDATTDESDLDADAVRETGSQGTLSYSNESGLLQVTKQLIMEGTAHDMPSYSFAIAIQICVLTHAYWTVPDALISHIISPVFSATQDSVARRGVCVRVSVALSRLLRTNPYVVQDSNCMLAINDTLKAIQREEALVGRDPAQAIEDNISESLEALTHFDRLSTDFNAVQYDGNTPVIDVSTIDVQVLAEQLTLVEQRFFDAVSVSDFVKMSWNRAANPVALWVQHSNLVTRWLASRILQTSDRKARAKVISKFIKLANTLRNMSNFSSMMCVYLALSMDCIAKLQKTWSSGAGSLLNQFTRLSELIRPLHNFAGYREDLRTANSPGIPYLGVLMKDIVSLEEVLSASSRTPSGMESAPPSGSRNAAVISFNNLEMTSRIIQSQFLKFKKTKYRDLTPSSDAAVITELLNPSSFNLIPENDMSDFSQLLEHKRSSMRVDMPKLPLSAVPAETAGGSKPSTPHTPIHYGLRSSQSFSAPVSPHLGEGLLSSNQSTPSASPSPWKGNIERCIANLQAMKDLQQNRAQYQFAQDVAEALSAAGGMSQVIPGRKKKQFMKHFLEDLTAELAPLEKLSLLEGGLFSNFPQLVPPEAAEWKREIIVSEGRHLSLHRPTLVSIYSTTLPIILAAVKVLALKELGGETRLLVSGSLSHPNVTMLHRITGKSAATDLSSAESSILALMCPQGIVDFVALRGSLSIQSAEVASVQVDIQIVFEVKPERGLRSSAPVN